jgi:TPR repeat protein
MMIKYFAGSIAFMFAFAATSLAQDAKVSTQAASQQENLISQAQNSNPEAQVMLGKMYMKGEEFPLDYEKGIEWIKKAADAGNADAQNELGQIYLQDKYSNYNEALLWFNKAAKQKYTPAINNLARMYEIGLGIAQNRETALKYYKMSADLGDVFAMAYLGSYYLHIQDYENSFKWYEKAAEAGDAESEFYLGAFYENGLSVPKDARRAVVWYEKSAAKNYVEAQFALAELYNSKKEYKKALDIYVEMSNAGNAGAQKRLGDMYYYGYGVKKNFGEAFKWYETAANQSLPDAMFMLGKMYYSGTGVKMNKAKGGELIEEAAELGLPDAQEELEKISRASHLRAGR